MKRALEDLAVPAPIGAEEEQSGPAALAMAASALDGVDAGELADRLEPTEQSIELARQALTLGYHVHYHTPDPDEVDERALDAGLVVHDSATVEDVETSLACRHAVIVSSLDDGPPFLLVPRRDEDGLVVHDPSVDERPLTWSWERLSELLAAEPRPRVLRLGPRTRSDR